MEYIIIDGRSTDRTVDIIKEYAKKYPIKWISEKDNGIYDAINKGFSMATGDIYAWINSDDTYLPNAFKTIANIFKESPQIKWINGRKQTIDENSNIIKTNPFRKYKQSWIKKGIYGRYGYFIHQDSVFWRKELWDKVGGINTQFKFAGDYWLWSKFAEISPLHSINVKISKFRKRKGQLSENMNEYRKEQLIAIPPQNDWESIKARIFFSIKTKIFKKFKS